MNQGLIEKLHPPMYKHLIPGDIEMGNNNPMMLYASYLKIIDHLSHLDDSRKKDGLNLCFLSSGSARAEVYVLENICEQIHRLGIKIKKVILTDTSYDDTFMKSKSNKIILILDRLIQMNCLEKYSLLSDHNKLYENEFKEIISAIQSTIRQNIPIDEITKKYKIDMFIAFHYQDSIFIPPGTRGYIEFLHQFLQRFNLYQRLSMINKLCGSEIIPQKVLSIYNVNNKIQERMMMFPSIRAHLIPGITTEITKMLANKDISDILKKLLRERYDLIIVKYEEWKNENKSIQQITSQGQLQSQSQERTQIGGKHYDKYIANKNKYFSFS
jgi:hypothetical protein